MPTLHRLPACSIFAGLIVIRSFIIYHDYQHHTILHNSKAAKIMMTIFGWYILAPASIWKRSHDYHHQHNSKLFSADIGSYPIVTKDKFQRWTANKGSATPAIRHPLTMLFGHFSMFIWGMCGRSFLSNPRKHLDCLLAVLLDSAASILNRRFFGFEGWLLAVLIPYFVGHAMGFSCSIGVTAQLPRRRIHRCGMGSHEGAAMESSSYMRMSPFMQWCTGNIGFHHIHHLNCRIPFYKLPLAMQRIGELQNAKITTLKPKDILACLRLKVWDPETQQMIGYREIRLSRPQLVPADRVAPIVPGAPRRR